MTMTARRDRVGVWIAVLATAVGMWMGLSAPSVSPVAPPSPGISAPADPGQAP